MRALVRLVLERKKKIRKSTEMIALLLLLPGITHATPESVVCLDNIITTYFEEKTIVVVTTDEFLPPYDQLDSLKDKSIIFFWQAYQELSTISRYLRYDILIFNLKNTRDLSKLFKRFKGVHNGKIVVTVEDSSRHLARHIISILWDLTRETDVIVLMTEDEYTSVYSWFPYAERECSEVKEIVLMDTWSHGSFVRGTNLFPKKITKDLKGCPLFVSTRPIEPYVITPKVPGRYLHGYEVMLVCDIVREYNMSLKVVLPPDPSAFWITETGGKRRGVFDLLLRHDLDVVFGGIMARDDRYQLTDATYPYTIEHMLWIYPKRSFKTHFSSIYVVFAPELWFVIVIFHVSAAFAFFLADKYHPAKEVHYTGFISCLINAMAILCNTTFPLPRNTVLRVMVMSYVIYAIHLSAAYQSYLVVLLTHNELMEPFRNIHQLADTNWIVHLFASGHHLYNKTDHAAWEKLLQPGRLKYIDGLSIYPIVNNIAVNRSSFLLFPKGPTDFITSVMYPDGGKSLFEYLHYLTYPLTMYVSPGNPLQFPISNHIQALIQTGIFQHWKKMTMAQADKGDRHVYKEIGKTAYFPEALGIKHLEGAFLLWCLSLASSLIVFLGEILFHRLNQTKATQQKISPLKSEYSTKIKLRTLPRFSSINTIHNSLPKAPL